MHKSNTQRDYHRILHISNLCFLIAFSIFSSSFAQVLSVDPEQKIALTFYITANTGLDETNKTSQEVLNAIINSSQEDKDATLLIVGNITNEK